MDGRSRSEANNNLVNMAHPYVCYQFKYANDLIGIVFYFFVIVGSCLFPKKQPQKCGQVFIAASLTRSRKRHPDSMNVKQSNYLFDLHQSCGAACVIRKPVPGRQCHAVVVFVCVPEPVW